MLDAAVSIYSSIQGTFCQQQKWMVSTTTASVVIAITMSFLVSGVGTELRRSLRRRGRAQDWEQLCPLFGTVVSNISASEVDICELL